MRPFRLRMMCSTLWGRVVAARSLRLGLHRVGAQQLARALDLVVPRTTLWNVSMSPFGTRAPREPGRDAALADLNGLAAASVETCSVSIGPVRRASGAGRATGGVASRGRRFDAARRTPLGEWPLVA